MDIVVQEKDTNLTIQILGSINTLTAPQLEKEVTDRISGKAELVFDFSKVVYISSAGLRVLLMAQKIMNKQGSMKLLGVNDDIMGIFVASGFVDILTIE